MANFEGYRNNYHGTVIESEERFKNVIIKAEAFLNKITFGRIREYEGEDKENALYELCDIIHNHAEHDGIASENTDGYSVSYRDVNSDTLHRRMCSVAAMYLPHHLLYRGI